MVHSCLYPFQSLVTTHSTVQSRVKLQKFVIVSPFVNKSGILFFKCTKKNGFFFFSGGRDLPFDNEDRILIPSPKVKTYDLQPEMSAPEVATALCDDMDTQKHDCIILNFANGDMVGHTGVYESIRQAVVTIDICVDRVVQVARRNGYDTIIIADHGNADHAINADGTPNTEHSLNPVPCVYVPSLQSPDAEQMDQITIRSGKLADVAPTLLHLLCIQQPETMTGQNLIQRS